MEKSLQQTSWAIRGDDSVKLVSSVASAWSPNGSAQFIAGPVAVLGEGQESEGASGQTRGRRGLGAVIGPASFL
jgi:hypothetical protein